MFSTVVRDLIVDAGGPSDSRASGLTVRFPRQGEPSDTVTITAPTAVATKIKAALEKEVAALQSRVVWGVQVHQSHHRTVIGKGASALQELQKKHGIKIIMPGWNEWAATGEVANAEEVKDVAPSDLVKLSGPRDAVIAAAAELKVRCLTVCFGSSADVPRIPFRQLDLPKPLRSIPSKSQENCTPKSPKVDASSAPSRTALASPMAVLNLLRPTFKRQRSQLP